VNSLTTAITGHPCAWQSGDGMRWIVYEKAGGLWLVSWDGINTSIHTEIVSAGMGPAAVRMAPSNDVALFWATREGNLLVDRLERTGTGYQMEGTPTTIVDVSEGDYPPVGYASDAVQDLTGRICVFYDCGGKSQSCSIYTAWLTADFVTLNKQRLMEYIYPYKGREMYSLRAVSMRPSAAFLLFYLRQQMSVFGPTPKGLYVCQFTNTSSYYSAIESQETLITADADDLYGIDRQPSGVYTVHYIHDGTRQEMTSSDGGVTWA